LSKKGDLEILVLERNETILGENQSSRNSGVIHAGIYYAQAQEPGKARLCVEGNRRLYEFCQEQEVPCLQCGKLVVATDDLEEEYLDQVLAQARENGVPGVKKILGPEVTCHEPNVRAQAGLLVPSSGIIEPTRLVQKLYTLAKNNQVMFLTGNRVIGIEPQAQKFLVTTQSKDYTESVDTDILINAAGLFADDIACLVNPDCPHVIEPTRGESARFYKNIRETVGMKGMNVYPAPFGYYNDTGQKARVSWRQSEALLEQGIITKTVGVHLSPTFDVTGTHYRVGNTVTIGPLKTVGVGKEDYARDLKSPAHFYEQVKAFFPGLNEEDVQLHQAGIMAVLKTGRDFVIEPDPRYPGCINLIGIDSPGLTSCLAIARQVAEMIP
jgi:L-2-hydroxyglutarate oxidase LhgO